MVSLSGPSVRDLESEKDLGSWSGRPDESMQLQRGPRAAKSHSRRADLQWFLVASCVRIIDIRSNNPSTDAPMANWSRRPISRRGKNCETARIAAARHATPAGASSRRRANVIAALKRAESRVHNYT